jgi:hypothetical protein
MNPIAWMVEGYDGIGSHIRTVVSSKPKHDSWVSITPLYTAPRELSDYEIMELAEYHGINDWLYETSVTDFAKAILKKASEE